jgi:trimeric autotransporter adhesin
MKTKFYLLKTILLLIVTITFGIYQVNGQSSFSGTDATYNNTLGAGATGDINLGESAGVNNSSSNGIFIGFEAGFDNTGDNNTFIGRQTGYSSTGGYNTFIGYLTGFSNLSGFGNTANGNEALYSNLYGYLNCAYGINSLYRNDYGGYNNAFGEGSLYSNLSGNSNCAFGSEALKGNVEGENNCAFGNTALYSNNGFENLACGVASLYANTSGNSNTAIGSSSMITNSEGNYNSALGSYSLYNNTKGGYNTALGYYSLDNNTDEEYNTALGSYSDVIASYSASTAIGANAIVDGQFSTAIGYNAVASGSNIVQLGDANCTGVYTYTAYLYNTSDGRFKFNITDNVSGLKFINKLRPVTYQYNTEALDDFVIKDFADSVKVRHKQGINYSASTAKIHSGFIAQEVKEASDYAGFNSSIVSVPADTNKGIYGISYTEIVVPLVKAVQELSKSKDSLSDLVKNYEIRLLNLENMVNACCSHNKSMINNGSGQGDVEKVINIELADDIILYQNEPNPFGENTIIRYYIPSGTEGHAYIVFYDLYGKEINKVVLTERGFGKINADTQKLSGGVYTYSLMINGIIKDAKKMIKE